MGGIGIENWILQNGGSFVQACHSFLDAAVDERVLEKDLVPSEHMLEKQAYPDDYLYNLMILKKMNREEKNMKIVFLHSKQ